MEVFSIFGLIAFVLVISYLGLPAKIKRLENQVKRLKKENKGELQMSKMFEDLKDKKCKITLESGAVMQSCKVIDLDNDWIKIISTDKKQKETTIILRIDDIQKAELI